MRWVAAIVGLMAVGVAAAFWCLDFGTAMMAVFAAVAAGFFGSLPWIVGGVMDRKKAERSGGVVVKGFEERRE